jgi:hypothetical protein
MPTVPTKAWVFEGGRVDRWDRMRDEVRFDFDGETELVVGSENVNASGAGTCDVGEVS